MVKNLTPLEVCERLIGPFPVISDVVGYSDKAPYLWRRAVDGRDAGDFPSTRIQRQLLSHARAHGIPLTAEHLIWGAEEAEIEALLAARRREDAA